MALSVEAFIAKWRQTGQPKDQMKADLEEMLKEEKDRSKCDGLIAGYKVKAQQG